jgi:putative endonuclease
MSHRSRQIGNEAESLACLFLQAKDWKVLERNFRCKLGEIDLIALNRGRIEFVEVRSSNQQYLAPSEMIDNKKLRKLRRLSLFWQMARARYNDPVALSLITIQQQNNRECKLTHFEDL